MSGHDCVLVQEIGLKRDGRRAEKDVERKRKRGGEEMGGEVEE